MSNGSENDPVVIEGLSPAEISGDAMRPPPPEPAPEAPPAPPARRRSGFGGTVLGGLIAAGLGYGGAAWLGDASWPFRAAPAETVDLPALQAQVADLSAAVTALTAGPAADAAALGARIDELTASLAVIAERADAPGPDLAPLGDAVAALDTRLTALEKAPVTGAAAGAGATAPAVAAFQRDLDALSARVETLAAGAGAGGAGIPAEVTAAAEAATARIAEAEAALTARQDSALAAASAAGIRAALAGAGLALDQGGDLGGALAAAATAGAAIDPAALGDTPALVELQRSFPAAARRALQAAARAPDGAGMGSRLGAFLKGQFSPRSLQPQEGDGADAILSRAEAALRETRVADALALTGTLPAPARAEMADWEAAATRHLAARAALEAALAALPAN